MKSYSADDTGLSCPSQGSMQRDIAVVNVERADNLALSLGRETYEHVVQLFVEQAKDSVEEINGAVRNRSYEEVAGLSHSMKGSASTIGCDFLADLYKRLEHAAKDEEPDKLNQLTADLQGATLQALAALAYRL